jgi:hypothetical protein
MLEYSIGIESALVADALLDGGAIVTSDAIDMLERIVSGMLSLEEGDEELAKKRVAMEDLLERAVGMMESGGSGNRGSGNRESGEEENEDEDGDWTENGEMMEFEMDVGKVGEE